MYKLISYFIQGGIYPEFSKKGEKQQIFTDFGSFSHIKSVLKIHFGSLTSIILFHMIREIKLI